MVLGDKLRCFPISFIVLPLAIKVMHCISRADKLRGCLESKFYVKSRVN